MRYFPIHILVKDFLFFIILYLVEKLTHNAFAIGWWGTKEILGASLYIEFSLFFLNLIIFAIIHFILFKIGKTTNSFLFGASLHLPTLLLAFLNLEISIGSFLSASIISLIISGYLFKKLNSGFSFEKSIRKCAGVE